MNPYRNFPSRQYWSRAVSRGLDFADVGTFDEPLISYGDQVISAGSCFAANLVPYLQKQGFSYLRTEERHPVFGGLPADNFSYEKFSAGYGNVYTTRQLLQLIRRAKGLYRPIEDRWVTSEGIRDPYRPGLRYFARSHREFDVLTERHLAACLKAFRECSVFIFTLGLTEAWISKVDGAVFPACPGTISGIFDAEKHAFINFTVQQVSADLKAAIAEFREINPDARIILTVSPVPLVATATGNHVLSATIYSKSVLRIAAEEAAALPNVCYFPSYEIVTAPGNPEGFFEPDRRNVSKVAVDQVMGAFLANCQGSKAPEFEEPQRSHGPSAISAQLSNALAALECEEAGQDSLATGVT